MRACCHKFVPAAYPAWEPAAKRLLPGGRKGRRAGPAPAGAGVASGDIYVWQGDSKPRAAAAIKAHEAGPKVALCKLPAGPAGVRALHLSADGTRLLSGGGDGRIKVWDVADGALREEACLETRQLPVGSAAKGSAIVAAAFDGGSGAGRIITVGTSRCDLWRIDLSAGAPRRLPAAAAPALCSGCGASARQQAGPRGCCIELPCAHLGCAPRVLHHFAPPFAHLF